MKPDAFSFEHAIARFPRWILLLSFIGTAWAFRHGGVTWASGFLTGALAAYFNFRVIERAVNRVARLASREDGSKSVPRGHGSGIWIFIQFAFLALAVFVILECSGANLIAAMCGFFVCPAAAILEILYELLTYGHS